MANMPPTVDMSLIAIRDFQIRLRYLSHNSSLPCVVHTLAQGSLNTKLPLVWTGWRVITTDSSCSLNRMATHYTVKNRSKTQNDTLYTQNVVSLLKADIAQVFCHRVPVLKCNVPELEESEKEINSMEESNDENTTAQIKTLT